MSELSIKVTKRFDGYETGRIGVLIYGGFSETQLSRLIPCFIVQEYDHNPNNSNTQVCFKLSNWWEIGLFKWKFQEYLWFKISSFNENNIQNLYSKVDIDHDYSEF